VSVWRESVSVERERVIVCLCRRERENVDKEREYMWIERVCQWTERKRERQCLWRERDVVCLTVWFVEAKVDQTKVVVILDL